MMNNFSCVGLGFGVATIVVNEDYRWAGIGCATVGNMFCFYGRRS